MFPLLELINMALLSLVTVLMNPLFWGVLFLVYMQYKRIHALEVRMMGSEKSTMGEKMINAVFMGILGGILGTVVIMVLGVTVTLGDFTYLLPLAILLMLIHVRYLCFSYGGGVLALSSLIFGFPKINVPGVMVIVGVLHLVESILMWLDGHKNAAPIFIQDKRYGIIGGFMLQRFWPIPFAILLVALGSLEGARELNLPDWWPIFGNSIEGIGIENLSLQISVVVAALGYGDMAISGTPREKSKRSAVKLLLFSIILILLSVLAVRYAIFQWLAALFSPLGHEALIICGQREERKKEPVFRQYGRGITVLDTKRGGHGEKMGLEPGDVILTVNNYPIDHKEDMEAILKDYPPFLWVEILDRKGRYKTLEYKNYQRGIGSLGIIIVPKETQIVFDPDTSISLLKKLISRFRRKGNSLS